MIFTNQDEEGRIVIALADERDRLVAEVPRLQAENARLRQDLTDAVELAEEGWSYATEYFKSKWTSEERIAVLRAVLAKLEGGT